ncbi:MAG: SpoIIE family protein phosphatase [Desulfobacterales bacterium]
MEGLPPGVLGANIAAAFGLAYVVRRLAEHRVVESAPEERQPRRQLFLDFALGALAALTAAAQNVWIHGFPPLSTLGLIYGVLVYGFFIAMDTALARERVIIRRPRAEGLTGPPARQLHSITRRFTLFTVAAVLGVSLVNLAVIARDISWLATVGAEPEAVRQAVRAVTFEVLFILAVLLTLTVNLVVSFSQNLRLLFRNETEVLERVTQGDLSRLVPVATRDEFGLIASYTNAMIEALRHRIRLLSALKLAEEVQANLLPSRPPEIPGVELAGTSRYCEEIGGDYYDFIPLPEGAVAVVVADVAGHGVDAALFMASARSFLLSQAQRFRGGSRLLRVVNRYITRDSAQTGRFISLFLLEIRPAEKRLRWVRAGHGPGLLYEPGSGRFRELDGAGMALGVSEEARFPEYEHAGWEPGSLVVIATDGLIESRNPQGELFGAGRLREAVRAASGLSAPALRDRLIAEVEAFRGTARQEDDVTLVVARLA